MARFLYFVPDVQTECLQGIPHGLHPRTQFDRASVSIRNVAQGPGGAGGCIVALSGPDEWPEVGYFPERQTWIEFDGFQIGWYPDHVPTPETLLRPHAPEGDPVMLADGREWHVPLLGPATRKLPGVLVEERGELFSVVQPEFDALCRESEFWFDTVRQEASYPFKRFFRFACDCLGVRYYVGRPEATALRLVSDRTLDHAKFLAVALGFVRLDADGKKNAVVGG